MAFGTIDATKPTDGVAAVKSDLRSNLTVIDRQLRGTVNLKNFGATLDGSASDNSAFQDALDYIADRWEDGESILRINGRCKLDPSTIDWSEFGTDGAPKRRLTLIVDGRLRLESTLFLRPRMSLIGIGGVGTSAQFEIGPACIVEQLGTWTEPVIQAEGVEDHYIEGIYIEGPYGPGIQLGYSEASSAVKYPEIDAGYGFQSSLFDLRRIGVSCRSGVSTSEGLRLENAFWVWVNGFSFLGATGSGPAIHFADSFSPLDPGTPGAPPYSPGNPSGLVDIRNGVIANTLIKISRATGHTSQGYHFWFDNVHCESQTAAFITIGDGEVNIDDLQMSRIGFADQVAGESAHVDNTVGGTIGTATIRSPNLIHQSRLWIGRPPTDDIHVENAFRSNAATGGSNSYNEYRDLPFKFHKDADGETEACDGFRGGHLLPTMIPADAKNLLTDQAISGWTASSCSVSSDQGLDGSATGHKLTFSGAGSMHVDCGVSDVTDHWLICGCWFRSDNVAEYIHNGSSSLWELYMLNVSSHYWDGDAGVTDATWYYQDRDARKMQVEGGWFLLSEARKFNASSTTSMRFAIRASHADVFIAWRPFLVALPASEYTRRDVSRFLSKLAIIDGGAKPGVLSQLPNQTFRTGLGATGSRPSASAVGAGAMWYDTSISKLIVSDGSSWLTTDGGTP